MLNLRLPQKLYPPAAAAALSTVASPFFVAGDSFFTAPPSDHLPTSSKDDPLCNPPVTPWPKNLHPNHLVSIINRQPTLDLAFQVFEYAGKFHPGFTHTHQTYKALITRLARGRQFHRAETLLSQLQESGINCHGEAIFITLIRNYGIANRPKEAFWTFMRIMDFGVQRSVRSLNCLLDALVMNRKYDWVHLLFKNYKKKFGVMPDVITCNILVKALCKKRDINGALEVFDEMPGMGIVPNLVTYTTIIFGYVECGDLEGARRVFQEISDKGMVLDVMTYTVMINGYCKEGRLVDAVKVMDEMEETGVRPNVVTYSTMIEAYCRERKPGEAVNLLVDMLNQQHVPSMTLCCKVIDVLCQEEKVEDACSLWKKLLKMKFTLDDATSSTIIHWLCKKGKVLEAKRMFSVIEKGSGLNLLTYNALIGGMVEAGELVEASKMRYKMFEKKCILNSFTYHMLIKGFCAADNPKEGMRLFQEMVRNGCLPNESTCSMLIDGLASLGLEAELDKLLSVIAKVGGRI